MVAGYSKQQLEDAIFMVLGRLSESRGGYIKTMISYSGKMDERQLKDLSVSFPALIVSYSGSTYKKMGYPEVLESCRYRIFICTRTMSGRTAGLAGSSTKPGHRIRATEKKQEMVTTSEIVDDIRLLLHGSDLGLDIIPFELLSEEPFFSNAEIELYKAEYQLGNTLRA